MWWLRIIALNGVAGVIDFLCAVEGTYFEDYPPFMDSCQYPILGILFQSYLGSASD